MNHKKSIFIEGKSKNMCTCVYLTLLCFNELFALCSYRNVNIIRRFSPCVYVLLLARVLT